MYKVSELMDSLPDSAVSTIISTAAKENWSDILPLAGGEPKFNIPEGIIESLLNIDRNLITKYSPFCGYDVLLQLIQKKLQVLNNIHVDKEEIIVVPGGSSALTASIFSIANPGDEILISDPCWEHYPQIIKLCRAVPVRFQIEFKNNRYEYNIDKIEQAITKNTKAILINTPLNPCGAMLSLKEGKELIELCEKYKVWIIVDEEYESFVYDNNKHLSLQSLSKNVISLYSFSKSFALTGLRLGYVSGPKDIINLIRRYGLYTYMSPPSPSQCLAIEVLSGNYVDFLKSVRDVYQNKMDCLYAAINNIPGISCWRPEGGVYLFPRIQKGFMDSQEIATHLFENYHLLSVPGYVAGDSCKQNIRLFVGLENVILNEAAVRLSRFLVSG